MSELSEKEELKKQKILVDIYKNENDHLKHEYRVLYDKFILTKNEYDKVNSNYSLLNEKYEKLNAEMEQFKNSRICKLFMYVKQTFLYKFLKKVKNRFSKKG